jgi:hypothetical protein
MKIDLKREKMREDEFGAVAMPSGSECPRAYIDGPRDLADLPKKGTITFEFERDEMTVRDGASRPVSMSLKLKAIVAAEGESKDDESDEDEDYDSDAGESLDRKFKRAVEPEEIDD